MVGQNAVVPWLGSCTQFRGHGQRHVSRCLGTSTSSKQAAIYYISQCLQTQPHNQASWHDSGAGRARAAEVHWHAGASGRSCTFDATSSSPSATLSDGTEKSTPNAPFSCTSINPGAQTQPFPSINSSQSFNLPTRSTIADCRVSRRADKVASGDLRAHRSSQNRRAGSITFPSRIHRFSHLNTPSLHVRSPFLARDVATHARGPIGMRGTNLSSHMLHTRVTLSFPRRPIRIFRTS